MDARQPYQIVAIDGPAAAGKSTVAQALADELGAMLFDTGALYRAVTLLALRTSTPVTDGVRLARLVADNRIVVAPASVRDGRLYDVQINGEDVTWRIRQADIDAAVSPVSAHPEVRRALLDLQRAIARQGRVVMVGRDIGTVVVPDASVKVFLTASADERARRRHLELLERGVDSRFDDVLVEIKRRDGIDRDRDIAPLQPAPDAIVVDTDRMSLQEVIELLVRVISRAWRQPAPA